MLESVSPSKRQAIEELSARYDEPQWLLQQRLEAWHLYEDMPEPNALDEEWRRTNLDAVSLDGLRLFPGPLAHLPAPRRSGRNGYGGEIVQRDGMTLNRRLTTDLEQQSIVFSDLHAAARDYPDLFRAHFMTHAVQPISWKLIALHAAIWRGGVFLYVPAGVQCEVPLHAVVGLDGHGAAVFPHTLIVAEKGSSVTLVEEHASRGNRSRSLSSGVVEILVRDGASVRYVSVQDWGRNVDSFSTIRAVLGEESQLELGLVGSGSRFAKANVEAILAAPGANAKIIGLFLAGGDQHMAYSTLQDHRAPATTSDLLFKSVLKDGAYLVWNGLTRIHKGAGESDANQSSRNLLLGENAGVAPIPVLEIEAHDVTRCSHGATVSSVDEEQLYYMMSRGLTREDATHAIVDGFLRQGLERLEPVRDHKEIGRALARRLLAEVT
jgi:Fe-S cluster assembly protein SufD